MNDMKVFETPELEVIRFLASDIITTSTGENELPITPFSLTLEDELEVNKLN